MQGRVPQPESRPGTRRPPATTVLSPRIGGPRAAREIAKAVQNDIAQGRLPLGSRLPNERELARHYQVSQPTIREAVRALDIMGLVDVRHGSGVYVTGDIGTYLAGSFQALLQIERVGILDVLDLRTLLGGFSARRAAEKASGAEVDAMRRFLDAIDRPAPNSDVRELVRPPVSFQLTVSAAGHNPLLFAIESFLIRLLVQMQLTAMEHHGVEFWRRRVSSFGSDRRRLLRSIADRDQAGAVEAMETYLGDQHALFASDGELAEVSVSDPALLAGLLDLPDLRRDR
ncbi:MAG: GntR family transcriptional regulator [Pseudonocardiaceae bacterium]|nr:GntR family transcriptional regulator [Pseudonocardiaceae bacterium]